ncbi:unnamed protein product [Cladocopium goreaui]|uniref:Uncharacterized protein n=1 Tax=Cladocopium goreaui TaxID=2562237 RepID=A0A9P1GGU1_9DINO|nr:unnamed protein product [Cladocopium goreaui]
MLAQDLQGHRRNTQSPEDVVRMLLLAAPDAGRPPPEIVGAALKAAGVPINDQNLIRALEEAAGARGGNPSREDVVRARSGAHDYKVAPRPDSDGGSSGSEDSASGAPQGATTAGDQTSDSCCVHHLQQCIGADEQETHSGHARSGKHARQHARCGRPAAHGSVAQWRQFYFAKGAGGSGANAVSGGTGRWAPTP